MAGRINEKRRYPRTRLDSSDTGHRIEGSIRGKHYRFRVLDTGEGGIGILVEPSQSEILTVMQHGARLTMDYINPNGCMSICVEIRHVTLLTEGPFKGSHSVGFSISIAY